MITILLLFIILGLGTIIRNLNEQTKQNKKIIQILEDKQNQNENI
ncbi:MULTISPECIES: hypothetical protein [Paraliobacillus]|nr:MULTISPECIES: hypothetical protein [Paraliobacillus]